MLNCKQYPKTTQGTTVLSHTYEVHDRLECSMNPLSLFVPGEAPPPVFSEYLGKKGVLRRFSMQEGVQQACTSELVSNTIHGNCAECCISFKTAPEHEAHIAQHHAPRDSRGRFTVTCSQCPAQFKRQDHLKRHIKSFHHNEKFCVCPVCRKPFPRQDILLNHIKKNHNNNVDTFRCRVCEYSCNSHTQLEEHEKENHANPDLHLCTYCNAHFKRRDHMLRHVKSQHLNQCISCPICNQKYKRRDHVTRHMREKHKMGLSRGHDQQQEIKPGATVQAQNINIGTNIYQNICRICEFGCNSQEHAKENLTDLELHICKYCNSHFKRRDHMLRHIKSQHLNECISCPICNQQYKRRDHVTRHMREKHKMGYVDNTIITSSNVN